MGGGWDSTSRGSPPAPEGRRNAAPMTTTQPTFEDYRRHIRVESARIRSTLRTCEPDAVVPSCPGWTAMALLGHHARVLHLWATFVERRPVGPAELDEPEKPERYDELLEFHQVHAERLVTALAAADPAEAAWTWSADQTVGFIARRQAHEALIHRVDAEQTAGAATPLDPRLAADGVDEVLDVMLGAVPSWGTFAGHRRHARFEMADTGGTVWVEAGRLTGTDPQSGEGHDHTAISVVADPGMAADTVVRGTAGVLDAWLWRRGDESSVSVTGDLDLYAQVRSCIDRPVG